MHVARGPQTLRPIRGELLGSRMPWHVSSLIEGGGVAGSRCNTHFCTHHSIHRPVQPTHPLPLAPSGTSILIIQTILICASCICHPAPLKSATHRFVRLHPPTAPWDNRSSRFPDVTCQLASPFQVLDSRTKHFQSFSVA